MAIFFTFQSYNEYGDIIKATVAKARELNKVNCARTMVASLISLFRELHDENGGLIISRNSNQFASLKVYRRNSPFVDQAAFGVTNYLYISFAGIGQKVRIVIRLGRVEKSRSYRRFA